MTPILRPFREKNSVTRCLHGSWKVFGEAFQQNLQGNSTPKAPTSLLSLRLSSCFSFPVSFVGQRFSLTCFRVLSVPLAFISLCRRFVFRGMLVSRSKNRFFVFFFVFLYFLFGNIIYPRGCTRTQLPPPPPPPPHTHIYTNSDKQMNTRRWTHALWLSPVTVCGAWKGFFNKSACHWIEIALWGNQIFNV